jgi:hypothetical protein
MQKYLDQYTKNMFEYTGEPPLNSEELHERWEDFKNKADMKTCKLLKEKDLCQPNRNPRMLY